MVLAVDTTWRWSRLTRVLGLSDTLFARFWSQTIRWLAGRDPDKTRPPIVVSTDKPDSEVGKPVTIRVVRQLTDKIERSSPAIDASTDVGVEVVGENGKAVPVLVKANSAEPDIFTERGGRLDSRMHIVFVRMEDAQGKHEGVVWMGMGDHHARGLRAQFGKFRLVGDNDRGGAGGLQVRRILFIGDKGQFAGTGAFDGLDTFNGYRGVTSPENAADAFEQILNADMRCHCSLFSSCNTRSVRSSSFFA